MEFVDKDVWEYPLDLKNVDLEACLWFLLVYWWFHINPLFIRCIWVCFSEVIWTMKIKPILGVSVCLLLTCASLPLNAEKRKCSKSPGKMLEAFFFLNYSKLSIVIPIVQIIFFPFCRKISFCQSGIFLRKYIWCDVSEQTNKQNLAPQKEVTLARTTFPPARNIKHWVISGKLWERNAQQRTLWTSLSFFGWTSVRRKRNCRYWRFQPLFVSHSLSLSLSLCLHMPRKKFPHESNVRI